MTLRASQEDSCETPGAQSILETREMYLRTANNRISRGQRRPRDSTNG